MIPCEQFNEAIMRNNRKCTLVKTLRVADTDVIIRMYILQSRYYVVVYDDGSDKVALKARGGFRSIAYDVDPQLCLFDPDIRKFWDKGQAMDHVENLYTELQEKYSGKKSK